MARALLAACAASAATAATLAPGVYTFTEPTGALALRHCDYQGFATPLEAGNDDFNFLLAPALNGAAGAVSFVSMNYPSMVITVTGAQNGASEPTRVGIAAGADPAASSFVAVPGLADPSKLSLAVAPGGQYAGLYVTRNTGKRSGSCAGNYNGDAGDVYLTDGADKAAATWAFTFVPPPPPPNVTISVTNVTRAVNPRMFGCHVDPGYTQQPTFWFSQMVYGESFEQGTMKVPSWVQQVDAGVTASIALDAGAQFNGRASMGFTYTAGSGSAGLANRGIGAGGMSLQGGRAYEGFVFVQGAPGTAFTVELQDFTNGGAVLASAALAVPAGAGAPNWGRVDFTLTPSAGTACAYIAPDSDPTIDCSKVPNADHACVRCGGQLNIALAAPSALHVGYVFLQPGAWGRVGDLPVPAAAGALVKAMGINIIRQGGTVSQSFRWKDWRGPAWERPSMQHVWGDSLVSGWGPFEMIELAEALNFEVIITLAYDLNSATDWGDLVEYVWGNASTSWGAMRIADRGGNPAPYTAINTWELGNEQENPDFVAQVESMEARATALGRAGELRFMYPTNQGVSQSTAAALLAAGFNASRFAPDIHVGAGGAIAEATADFNANPAFAQSAINCACACPRTHVVCVCVLARARMHPTHGRRAHNTRSPLPRSPPPARRRDQRGHARFGPRAGRGGGPERVVQRAVPPQRAPVGAHSLLLHGAQRAVRRLRSGPRFLHFKPDVAAAAGLRARDDHADLRRPGAGRAVRRRRAARPPLRPQARRGPRRRHGRADDAVAARARGRHGPDHLGAVVLQQQAGVCARHQLGPRRQPRQHHADRRGRLARRDGVDAHGELGRGLQQPAGALRRRACAVDRRVPRRRRLHGHGGGVLVHHLRLHAGVSSRQLPAWQWNPPTHREKHAHTHKHTHTHPGTPQEAREPHLATFDVRGTPTAKTHSTAAAGAISPRACMHASAGRIENTSLKI